MRRYSVFFFSLYMPAILQLCTSSNRVEMFLFRVVFLMCAFFFRSFHSSNCFIVMCSNFVLRRCVAQVFIRRFAMLCVFFFLLKNNNNNKQWVHLPCWTHFKHHYPENTTEKCLYYAHVMHSFGGFTRSSSLLCVNEIY